MVISNKAISCAEIMKRFPQLFVESIGDLSRTFQAIGSPENPGENSAIFLATPKAFAKGIESTALVLVVPRKMKAQAEAALHGRTLLIATNVELAMASVTSEYFLKTPYTNRAVQSIHPTAVVSSEAHIATGARIGPNAFIGAGVRLGANVYIGAGAVIEDDVEIGDDTVIHPLVFIGHSCVIGKRCEINPNSVVGKEGYGYAHDERGNHYRIPHQGRVVLEDDVHIGSCCTIDRGTFGETRLSTGAKLDNQVHLAHNCKIGKNSLLTAGFSMAGSSSIGANFVSGGRAVVTGHIEVCDNVQIAALSAVSKSITTPGQYGGNPLVPLQRFLKTKAALVQLPDMRKQLKGVLDKLGLNEESEESTAE